MRDAYGGIVNLTFIVVFIVIISGYLAFSVNYNKAFRLKNKIISAIEECEGITADTNDCANNEIDGYMREVGYSIPGSFKMGTGWVCPNNKGYCYKESTVTSGGKELGKGKSYYTVVTAVNIDMPIINRILPNVKFFQVSGNTKTITKH